MASFPSESPRRQVLRPQGDASAMLLLRREGRREKEKESVRRPTSAFRIFAAVTRDRQPDRRTDADEAGDCACDADLPVAAAATNSEMRRERRTIKRERGGHGRATCYGVVVWRAWLSYASTGPLWKHQRSGMEEEKDVLLDPVLSIIFRQRKRDQSYNVPRSP